MREKMNIKSLYFLKNKKGVSEQLVAKWYEVANKNLDQNDEIMKSHTGVMDDESGLLILSKKKIIFVEEKGTFSKSYNITLDIPYEIISKISDVGEKEIEITDNKGNRYLFEPSSSLNLVSMIEDEIKRFKET
jgi:hypothetical protein